LDTVSEVVRRMSILAKVVVFWDQDVGLAVIEET
jgi:hypothetical protein